jgi:hypothetical protein
MTIEKMDSLGKLYKTGKIGPNYQKRSLNKLKIHSFYYIGNYKIFLPAQF